MSENEESVTDPENESDASEAPEDEVNQDAEEEESEGDTSEDEDAEGDAADQDDEGEEEVDPRIVALEKKLAQQSYKNREQKRDNQRLMAILERQQAQDKTAPQPPKIEDFETLDEYLNARDEFKAQANSVKTADNSDQTDLEMANFSLSKDELYANGIAKHPDFADLVGSDDIDITLPMTQGLFAIDDIELQVDTAYYLGNNPEEASRIAQMTPVRQIAAVARISSKIEAKRTTKATKQPSKAPAPVKPVKTAKNKSNEIQPVEDFESFLKKRNKQKGRG